MAKQQLQEYTQEEVEKVIQSYPIILPIADTPCLTM
jgi:hypothetical protein